MRPYGLHTPKCTNQQRAYEVIALPHPPSSLSLFAFHPVMASTLNYQPTTTCAVLGSGVTATVPNTTVAVAAAAEASVSVSRSTRSRTHTRSLSKDEQPPQTTPTTPTTTRSSPSSSTPTRKTNRKAAQGATVVCPICERRFFVSEVEEHVQHCLDKITPKQPPTAKTKKRKSPEPFFEFRTDNRTKRPRTRTVDEVWSTSEYSQHTGNHRYLPTKPNNLPIKPNNLPIKPNNQPTNRSITHVRALVMRVSLITTLCFFAIV
jgi:hypothetical protein